MLHFIIANVQRSVLDLSGVVRSKTGRGRKLQLSDRQLQISDRGDYGCSKFQFCP